MDTQPPPPGGSGSNTGRLAGTASTTDILGTQECRYKLVHRDAANAATKHMIQDVHLKIVRKTGSRRNRKQHVVGCDYIHIDAISGQFTM